MMAAQLPLPPFVKTSETSRATAVSILPRVGTKEHLVLCFISICHRGGCTDEEGMTGLHMSGDTYRPRRIKLVEKGLVEDSGITRPTQSGQQAVVWKLKEQQA